VLATHPPNLPQLLIKRELKIMATPTCTTSASKINSKCKRDLLSAYSAGYRVINGEVFSKTGAKLKKTVATNGYFKFCGVVGSRTNNTRNRFTVFVHRLVAYQKYGNHLFDFECVRHLDGNKLNNQPENISVGSMSQNMLDIPVKKRIKQVSMAYRKYTDCNIELIKNFHSQYKSYTRTMNKFDIPSKGSLWYILNNNYVSNM